jgi:hypothetical protein
MQQLMDDDSFLEGALLAQKISTEGQSAGGRAGCPLGPHALDLDSLGLDVDPCRPMLDERPEGGGVASASHARLSRRSRSANSTIRSLPTAGRRIL